LCRVGR